MVTKLNQKFYGILSESEFENTIKFMIQYL